MRRKLACVASFLRVPYPAKAGQPMVHEVSQRLQPEAKVSTRSEA